MKHNLTSRSLPSHFFLSSSLPLFLSFSVHLSLSLSLSLLLSLALFRLLTYLPQSKPKEGISVGPAFCPSLPSAQACLPAQTYHHRCLLCLLSLTAATRCAALARRGSALGLPFSLQNALRVGKEPSGTACVGLIRPTSPGIVQVPL